MEVGDLVIEDSNYYGKTFGIVERIFELKGQTALTLSTIKSPNMIWTTYDYAIKFNCGKISVEAAIEKYPERLI